MGAVEEKGANPESDDDDVEKLGADALKFEEMNLLGVDNRGEAGETNELPLASAEFVF